MTRETTATMANEEIETEEIIVLLLENEQLVLESLTVNLGARGFRVLPVRDIDVMRRALQGVKPDVALIDLSLNDEDNDGLGFAAPAIIREQSPATLCMALTGPPVPALEEYVHRAMRDASEDERFDGFITKSTDTDGLVAAINSLLAAHGYVAPGLEKYLVGDKRNELTPMERRYLQARRDGLTGRTLIEALKMSQRQVVRYSDRVREKLGAQSIAEAVAEGLKRRLIR